MALITEFAPDVFLADGPGGSLWGLPVPERTILVRFRNGALLVYAPGPLSDPLARAVSALGTPHWLVPPNRRCLTHVSDWSRRWPGARICALPDCLEIAVRAGLDVESWTDIGSEVPWADNLDVVSVANAWGGAEVACFHQPSRTLIIGDLIVSLDTSRMPLWARPIVWLAGIDSRDPKMPPAFGRGTRAGLTSEIEQLLDWQPDRIAIARGDCIPSDGHMALARAFRRLLRDRFRQRLAEGQPKSRE